MLQRIQSVYLLCAVLFNLAALFLPQWQFSYDGQSEVISGLSVQLDAETPNTVSFYEHESGKKMTAHSLYTALNVLVSIFLLWLIFQFNDRPKQIRLGYIAIILNFIQILMMVIVSLQPPSLLAGGGDGAAQFGFAFPVVTVLLTYLAIRAIKKDEALVRSEDRIR